MLLVPALSVNEAFPLGISTLLSAGSKEDSRNGSVVSSPGLFVTEYAKPWHCVLFSGERDANPFFHLYEAIWMLAGSNRVESLLYFNPRMKDFSVDGKTLHGAYGYRWHNNGQLWSLLDKLSAASNTRQAVLSMWDADLDLDDYEENAKDRPCNLQAIFRVQGYKLNMTVTNRSNDLLWGMYGANAVHFAFLQRYVADALGLSMGNYTQVTVNGHLYTEKVYGDKLWNGLFVGTPQGSTTLREGVTRGETMLDANGVNTFVSANNLYARGVAKESPGLCNQQSYGLFYKQCVDVVRMFEQDPADPSKEWPDTPFWSMFGLVMDLFTFRKSKSLDLQTLNDILIKPSKYADTDWVVAACNWIKRREAANVVTLG